MREIALYILIALSAPAVLRRPFLGVVIYLGANIVRPEMLFWGGGGGSFVFITYYILILAGCLLRGELSGLGRIFQREYLLMLWMLAAIYLSILLTKFQVPMASYFATDLAKTLGLCGLLYLLIKTLADVELLETTLLGCLTFLGIWGIEQQMLGNERLEGLGGAAWGDSNGVASVYVLFLPVALAFAYAAGKRRRFWIFMGVAAVMVALIVCTKSRGGLLGMTACLFSFAIYARKTAATLKVALLFALVVAPFATDAYLERMKTLQGVSDVENFEGSARSRFILWEAGLMVFSRNPVVGTGFLTYPEAKMEFEGNFYHLEDQFREWVFRKESKKVTHNTYIQMLSDCGVFGALPFFLLVAGGIRSGFRARGRLKHEPHERTSLWLAGCSAGLTGFSVCIITIDSITMPFIYVQLVMIGILSRTLSGSVEGLPQVVEPEPAVAVQPA